MEEVLDGASLGESAERKYVGAAIAPSGALFVTTSALVLLCSFWVGLSKDVEIPKVGGIVKWNFMRARPFQRADLRPSL